MQHEWVPTQLNHGVLQCKYCLCTEREAAVIGMECLRAPKPVPTEGGKTFDEMDLSEKRDDIEKRVSQFKALALPGQPQMMHMGTSYLVGDMLKLIHEMAVSMDKALS